MLKKAQLPFLFFICLITAPILSQAQSEILDQYILQALESNHGLKEQQFLLEKNRMALEEARRLYKPEINFDISYTLATGGRDIQLPLGDLMNPVYSTLNFLTQTNDFPQIENEEIGFLPHNFYDARFRITQPLINREIYYNRKIKEEAISLKEVEIRVFKRELVEEVQVAYFQYLKAGEAVRIYESGLELLAENKRVNESLLRNDKVIPAVLMRIESEISRVKAQQIQAIANEKNAAAYFNFLLNKDLETEIEKVELIFNDNLLYGKISPIILEKREELEQLGTAQKINALIVDMEKSYKMPDIGLQVDVGSQNFDFKYGGYVLGGISVSLPIYAAGRNKLQIQQAELDVQATNEKMQQVKKQLELQHETVRNSLLAEIDTWDSYKQQLNNAHRQYRDTFRRYKEGVSNYIELLDARTQVTNIELEQSLALYNIFIKKAELQRAVASYPLD